MLHLKVETYQTLNMIHAHVVVRDLDAGVDDDPVLTMTHETVPQREGLDELDLLVLLAQQAVQRVGQSHTVRRACTLSSEED